MYGGVAGRGGAWWGVTGRGGPWWGVVGRDGAWRGAEDHARHKSLGKDAPQWTEVD